LRKTTILLLLAMSVSAAEKRVITPANGVPPVGPYSPGILVGDYLYVSGQGAAKPDGSFPTTTEEQTTQCLTNVRRIVEAAGLTMQNVVFATLYLKPPGELAGADRAWRAAFPVDPPARVVVDTTNMPVGTPVEVTVVAVRDLASRKSLANGTVETADRVYVSVPGERPGGVTEDHRLMPNILAKARPKTSGACKLAGNTLFCPAQSAPGRDVEAQVRGTMNLLRDELKHAGMTFANVVATNVYLDNIDDFARMNKVYAEFFGATPPTRTTVQLLPSTGKTLVRIALIAVK
jgi:enamine deaminase RidA (YjgF/YER057c/UK114 family)